MDRRFQEDSLIFFGQGSEFFEGSDPSAADERIRSYLDPGSRRRVVRRPGYQAPGTIVFSERGDGSLASSEPLSELLQQLAASRKNLMDGVLSNRPRSSVGGSGSASASVLSSLGLAGADGTERKRAGGEVSAVPASPAEQLRANFVQELMLSALSHKDDLAP